MSRGRSTYRADMLIALAVDALDNDEIQVDFRPLYQCMHIYEALDCKPELQRNYQEDRKVSQLVLFAGQDLIS